MPFSNSARACLIVTLTAYAAGARAQAVPPTAPTAAPAVPTPSQAPAQQAAPPPSRRAQISFDGGQLSVFADNSSLNQILRDISRATGMKITGGVTDERVYGSYGPSDTSTVLSALLRGTGSNMLLIFDAAQAPQELVLTPRAGGPTPPNPNASRDRDEEDVPVGPRMYHYRRPGADTATPPAGVPATPQGQTPVPQSLQQPVADPAQNQQPAQIGIPPANPPADTTTQESPNGVKTPQQIYEQLMKLQQQPKQQPPPPTAPQ